MQQIVEEVVRWFGFGVLKILTLGRYRGGGRADELSGGAIGLAVLIGTSYLV
ncbi:MAG: hypothetical protein M3541_15160 [Acidobacteriota bacterium]|jgi:hypothetical protein|nr:hypothetical protein [Acidobacteriota bacterium]MDQ3420088.1 hypothetical protein [Acidobacteriota bacterium]